MRIQPLNKKNRQTRVSRALADPTANVAKSTNKRFVRACPNTWDLRRTADPNAWSVRNAHLRKPA